MCARSRGHNPRMRMLFEALGEAAPLHRPPPCIEQLLRTRLPILLAAPERGRHLRGTTGRHTDASSEQPAALRAPGHHTPGVTPAMPLSGLVLSPGPRGRSPRPRGQPPRPKASLQQPRAPPRPSPLPPRLRLRLNALDSRCRSRCSSFPPPALSRPRLCVCLCVCVCVFYSC